MAAYKIVASFLIFLSMQSAHAFCGFYVAKADTGLFNKASKVVMVYDEGKTVLTMANDFKGDAKEFALVVPVPEVLEKGQVNVADSALIDHLDAYTSPRLVEYYDSDPCEVRMYKNMMFESASAPGGAIQKRGTKKDYGVTIEAEYTVGEYDILILSAKESGGLVDWLKDNDYKLPQKSQDVLGSYIKQGLKFFVAKVNLEEKAKLGFTYLRPIQVAYESKRFMLPLRLGTVNADGDQELFAFTLTKKGKVETVNYRTVKIPSDIEIPTFVKDKDTFSKFYKDMFSTAHRREEGKAVFLEYAWDMGWCDPCAADPLSPEQLKKLGVFWVGESDNSGAFQKRGFLPPGQGGPVNVFVTRLHLRYNAETFPDDLKLQETADRTNFQGRYIIRHPFTGEPKCEEAKRYLAELPGKLEKQGVSLAHVTGWSIEEIRSKMGVSEKTEIPQKEEKKWWQKLWN
jgi:hypothetical protein